MSNKPKKPSAKLKRNQWTKNQVSKNMKFKREKRIIRLTQYLIVVILIVSALLAIYIITAKQIPPVTKENDVEPMPFNSRILK
jgi:cell division protein FtsL